MYLLIYLLLYSFTPGVQGASGATQGRLRQQGLALAPLGGNMATLACYAFSQALARHLTDDPDLATLPLAALLLLLSQVPPLAPCSVPLHHEHWFLPITCQQSVC